MEKTKNIDEGTAQPLRQLLTQCRQVMGVAFALTCLIDLLGLTPMLYMMSAYDRVLTSRSGVTLVALTLVVIGFYVFWSALEWIRSRLMIRLSLRVDWELASDVFDAAFRRYADRKNVNVHQLLGDLLALRQFLTGQAALAIMDAPFALLFIVVGALFHPYLAIFAAVCAVLMVVVSLISMRLTTPILKEANNANADAVSVAAKSLRQVETTRALGMMPAMRLRWHDHHKRFLSEQVHASEAAGLIGGFSGFLQKALPSLQLGLAVFLAMENLITGGMVIVASMLIGKAVAPIQKLIATWKDIVAARQAYDRLNELLAQDGGYASTRMQLPPPRGQLFVQGATAVPPGSDKDVVAGVNFELDAGQVMAIVGPSAAGKTSMVRLLLGLWKPREGVVRLDGVSLGDWNHDELGPHIGYVPQEIEFFEGTVAENIARLGAVDAEKVIQATTLVGMHEAVLAFPKGYDTPLGDTGFVPSSGQRQRLAIARALYGMPKYLVMDEPNSNLDEAGETALMEVIRALKSQGSTVVLTTHRPRLMEVVDMMLVLKEGRQIAFGSAAGLLQAARQGHAVTVPGGDAS